MFLDAEGAVHYAIANTGVRDYPFPHFYLEGVFPQWFYQELLQKLPALSVYKRLDETGTVPKGAYPARFICSVEDAEQDEFSRGSGDFWERFRVWILSDMFTRLIMYKFRDGIRQRLGDDVQIRTATDCRLVRDFSTYAIPPHTDTQRKLVSLLFYLPHDSTRAHLGTSLFVPRDFDLRCDGSKHHDFRGFLKVATAPFRPNSLLAFCKNDAAFHGVEPILDADVERNVLLYNIYIDKLVQRPGATVGPDWSARSAPAWPWRTNGTAT